jgi:ribosomal protein L3
MTQIFTETGEQVPVTVLQVGPCTILQVKTPEKDGYSALQVGFDETDKPRKRPQQACLDRLGIRALKCVREVPYPAEDVLQSALQSGQESGEEGKEETPEGSADAEPAAPDEEAGAPDASEPTSKEEEKPEEEGGSGPSEDGSEEPSPPAEAAADEEPGEPLKVAAGTRISVSLFEGVEYVDVRGVTKGRGFAGTIRRYGFNTGPKSHGSKNIRQMGGTGMHTDPGRVFPGRPMPGHMGAVRRKARNLKVVALDAEENLLLVRGSVPGPRGGYVTVEESLG